MWFLVKSALCSLYPRTENLPGVADAGLDDLILRLRRDAPMSMKVALIFGGLFFAFSPILTVWLPVPTFFLTSRLRDKHANKIASHPNYIIRQLIMLLKMTASLAWGADPQVRAKMVLEPYPPDPGTWRQS